MMQLYNEKLDLFIYFLNSNSLVSVFLFDEANKIYLIITIVFILSLQIGLGQCTKDAFYDDLECHDKNKNQEFLITCRD